MSQNGIFASFNFDDSVDRYDYRSIIRAYLSSKKLKTVDAARAIEISAPFLSQVLNSRRSLPDDRAMLISRWMGFKGKQQKYFLLLVRYCNTSVQEIKDSLLIELEELLGSINTGEMAAEISHEVMAAISRWYHFAIFELVKLEDFEPNPY